MLLTIHNLPPDVTQSNIVRLVEELCGTSITLVDLWNDGQRSEATILADDGNEASIIYRELNGFMKNGIMLKVTLGTEDRRVSPSYSEKRKLHRSHRRQTDESLTRQMRQTSRSPPNYSSKRSWSPYEQKRSSTSQRFKDSRFYDDYSQRSRERSKSPRSNHRPRSPIRYQSNLRYSEERFDTSSYRHGRLNSTSPDTKPRHERSSSRSRTKERSFNRQSMSISPEPTGSRLIESHHPRNQIPERKLIIEINTVDNNNAISERVKQELAKELSNITNSKIDEDTILNIIDSKIKRGFSQNVNEKSERKSRPDQLDSESNRIRDTIDRNALGYTANQRNSDQIPTVRNMTESTQNDLHPKMRPHVSEMAISEMNYLKQNSANEKRINDTVINANNSLTNIGQRKQNPVGFNHPPTNIRHPPPDFRMGPINTVLMNQGLSHLNGQGQIAGSHEQVMMQPYDCPIPGFGQLQPPVADCIRNNPLHTQHNIQGFNSIPNNMNQQNIPANDQLIDNEKLKRLKELEDIQRLCEINKKFITEGKLPLTMEEFARADNNDQNSQRPAPSNGQNRSNNVVNWEPNKIATDLNTHRTNSNNNNVQQTNNTFPYSQFLNQNRIGFANHFPNHHQIIRPEQQNIQNSNTFIPNIQPMQYTPLFEANRYELYSNQSFLQQQHLINIPRANIPSLLHQSTFQSPLIPIGIPQMYNPNYNWISGQPIMPQIPQSSVLNHTNFINRLPNANINSFNQHTEVINWQKNPTVTQNHRVISNQDSTKASHKPKQQPQEKSEKEYAKFNAWKAVNKDFGAKLPENPTTEDQMHMKCLIVAAKILQRTVLAATPRQPSYPEYSIFREYVMDKINKIVNEKGTSKRDVPTYLSLFYDFYKKENNRDFVLKYYKWCSEVFHLDKDIEKQSCTPISNSNMPKTPIPNNANIPLTDKPVMINSTVTNVISIVQGEVQRMKKKRTRRHGKKRNGGQRIGAFRMPNYKRDYEARINENRYLNENEVELKWFQCKTEVPVVNKIDNLNSKTDNNITTSDQTELSNKEKSISRQDLNEQNDGNLHKEATDLLQDPEDSVSTDLELSNVQPYSEATKFKVTESQCNRHGNKNPEREVIERPIELNKEVEVDASTTNTNNLTKDIRKENDIEISSLDTKNAKKDVKSPDDSLETLISETKNFTEYLENTENSVQISTSHTKDIQKTQKGTVTSLEKSEIHKVDANSLKNTYLKAHNKPSAQNSPIMSANDESINHHQVQTNSKDAEANQTEVAKSHEKANPSVKESEISSTSNKLDWTDMEAELLEYEKILNELPDFLDMEIKAETSDYEETAYTIRPPDEIPFPLAIKDESIDESDIPSNCDQDTIPKSLKDLGEKLENSTEIVWPKPIKLEPLDIPDQYKTQIIGNEANVVDTITLLQIEKTKESTCKNISCNKYSHTSNEVDSNVLSDVERDSRSPQAYINIEILSTHNRKRKSGRNKDKEQKGLVVKVSRKPNDE